MSRLTRRSLLRGAATVGGATAVAGTAAGQGEAAVRPDWGGWLADADGGYRDARGESQVTVQVGAPGNGGNYAFSPAGLWVDPGTTVVWEWTGQGQAHNVEPEAGPASPDSGDPVVEAGTTYEFTFTEEHAGITQYYCVPHEGLGMLGAVAVGDDVPTVAVGGGGGGGPTFEWNAQTAVLTVVGGVMGLAAAAVLGAEAASGYRRWQRARADLDLGPATESAETDPAVELGHDEYDPRGTAGLIILYFLVVAVMWVIMYFVEFLGNGPTVVG